VQQVLYHFTIRKRIEDPRISILPAYDRIYDNETDYEAKLLVKRSRLFHRKLFNDEKACNNVQK
jgi:hypothetical protein